MATPGAIFFEDDVAEPLRPDALKAAQAFFEEFPDCGVYVRKATHLHGYYGVAFTVEGVASAGPICHAPGAPCL